MIRRQKSVASPRHHSGPRGNTARDKQPLVEFRQSGVRGSVGSVVRVAAHAVKFCVCSGQLQDDEVQILVSQTGTRVRGQREGRPPEREDGTHPATPAAAGELVGPAGTGTLSCR